MKYISTRNPNGKRYALKEAAFSGLASDGGLFVPERIPRVHLKTVEETAGQAFTELAAYLAGLFFGEEFSEAALHTVCRQAFDFPLELRKLGEEDYTLELFHGPTFAFKDFGAGFMGKMMGLLNPEGEDIVILTATSGDTGSAVAHGFYDIPGIRVVVLYPAGKVSPLQESQITTLGKNIFPLRVNGTFDDCQRLVKEVFNDQAYRSRKKITSANSINLLRWIPQSFYYFYGYFLWRRQTGKEQPDVVVPSGNYGNLSAAMLARQMGLPVRRFIAASNANDVFPEYLRTGLFRPRTSVHTVANAMDVGHPSNYERILYLYRNDFRKLTAEVKGYACDDAAIREAIATIWQRYGYLSDPHSAVGYLAARHYRADGFRVSTAHEAKFREVIGDIINEWPELPEGLKKMMHREKHLTDLPADATALKERLDDFISLKID